MYAKDVNLNADLNADIAIYEGIDVFDKRASGLLNNNSNALDMSFSNKPSSTTLSRGANNPLPRNISSHFHTNHKLLSIKLYFKISLPAYL